MTESIIVALITLVGTIVTVVFANKSTTEKLTSELKTTNAVQNVRIDNLSSEVKKCTELGVKIPKLEGDVRLLEEKLKVANKRIEDLEGKI